MGNFLKQPQQRAKKREPKKTKDAPEPARVVITGPNIEDMSSGSLQHDINHVAGLGDLQDSLDWIARGVNRLTSDDHAVSLFIGQGSNTYPIQLTLACNDYDSSDTMGRLVSAIERIADSLAKLAGLSRPLLERWHEQDEYTPPYKDIACDGGAPGPQVEPVK